MANLQVVDFQFLTDLLCDAKNQKKSQNRSEIYLLVGQFLSSLMSSSISVTVLADDIT